MSEVQACLFFLGCNVFLTAMTFGALMVCVKLVTEQMKETRHHKREMAEK
jgi:hypothetical protein